MLTKSLAVVVSVVAADLPLLRKKATHIFSKMFLRRNMAVWQETCTLEPGMHSMMTNHLLAWIEDREGNIGCTGGSWEVTSSETVFYNKAHHAFAV